MRMKKPAARKRREEPKAGSGGKPDPGAWLKSLPAAVRREIEAEFDRYARRLREALDRYFKGRRSKA